MSDTQWKMMKLPSLFFFFFFFFDFCYFFFTIFFPIHIIFFFSSSLLLSLNGDQSFAWYFTMRFSGTPWAAPRIEPTTAALKKNHGLIEHPYDRNSYICMRVWWENCSLYLWQLSPPESAFASIPSKKDLHILTYIFIEEKTRQKVHQVR